MMDEIGAAVAIPHSPQVWEEVHRVHHSHRARSIRSRSRSRSAVMEVNDLCTAIAKGRDKVMGAWSVASTGTSQSHSSAHAQHVWCN